MQLRIGFAVLALVLFVAAPAAATPDQMGPLTVTSWDAGMVALSGASIHVVVYYPTTAGTYPLVGVVHGASRNGTFQRVLAQTLASYGLVAVVPDMPCQVFACDHNANAMQLLAMLDWAVARSADTTTPIAGLVDGTRRGLTGHSWGALAAHIAASRDPTLRSVVLLDPNDDVGVGAAAASTIHAPELQLLAQNRGTCNHQWIASNVTPSLGGPVLQTTLPMSAHCDPEDPTDGLCPILCGNGDRATTPYFRRYAVAWTLCNLIGDPSMADWIGGAGFDADVTAGHLSTVVMSGLDTLRCRGTTTGDAGSPGDASIDAGAPIDAGFDARSDSTSVDATRADSANATDSQGADVRTADSVTTGDGSIDASVSDSGTVSTPRGCQCATVGVDKERGCGSRIALIVLSVLGVVTPRRRSRTRVQRSLQTR